jgi:hypothetical protein
MFEFIFELLFEVFAQVLWTALAEAGLHFARRPGAENAPTNVLLLVLGYSVLGAIAGGLSLLVFSNPFIHNQQARLANLVLAPIAGGLAMALLGAWRRKRGQATIQLDRFVYGYLFAQSVAFVRFFWVA